MDEQTAHPGGFREHDDDRDSGKNNDQTDDRGHRLRTGGETLASWKAWDFDGHPNAAVNLLLVGAALAIAGIVTAFFRNFLFALFLVIAGGLTASYAFREAREVSFAVTSRGVKIGERIYEFDSLQSFWITYDPPFIKELVLHSKKTVMPLIRIPLGAHDPLKLHEILLRFLREEKHEESLVDIIARRIGF